MSRQLRQLPQRPLEVRAARPGEQGTGHAVDAFRRGDKLQGGVKLFMMSKLRCASCFEKCTTEGRGGKKGGSANFKKSHTESFTILFLVELMLCFNVQTPFLGTFPPFADSVAPNIPL